MIQFEIPLPTAEDVSAVFSVLSPSLWSALAMAGLYGLIRFNQRVPTFWPTVWSKAGGGITHPMTSVLFLLTTPVVVNQFIEWCQSREYFTSPPPGKEPMWMVIPLCVGTSVLLTLHLAAWTTVIRWWVVKPEVKPETQPEQPASPVVATVTTSTPVVQQTVQPKPPPSTGLQLGQRLATALGRVHDGWGYDDMHPRCNMPWRHTCLGGIHRAGEKYVVEAIATMYGGGVDERESHEPRSNTFVMRIPTENVARMVAADLDAVVANIRASNKSAENVEKSTTTTNTTTGEVDATLASKLGRAIGVSGGMWQAYVGGSSYFRVGGQHLYGDLYLVEAIAKRYDGVLEVSTQDDRTFNITFSGVDASRMVRDDLNAVVDEIRRDAKLAVSRVRAEALVTAINSQVPALFLAKINSCTDKEVVITGETDSVNPEALEVYRDKIGAVYTTTAKCSTSWFKYTWQLTLTDDQFCRLCDKPLPSQWL